MKHHLCPVSLFRPRIPSAADVSPLPPWEIEDPVLEAFLEWLDDALDWMCDTFCNK